MYYYILFYFGKKKRRNIIYYYFILLLIAKYITKVNTGLKTHGNRKNTFQPMTYHTWYFTFLINNVIGLARNAATGCKAEE